MNNAQHKKNIQGHIDDIRINTKNEKYTGRHLDSIMDSVNAFLPNKKKDKKHYTIIDKRKYYRKKLSDPKSTNKTKKHATKRLVELNKY